MAEPSPAFQHAREIFGLVVDLEPAERAGVNVVPIAVAWDDEAALDRLLDPVLSHAR